MSVYLKNLIFSFGTIYCDSSAYWQTSLQEPASITMKCILLFPQFSFVLIEQQLFDYLVKTITVAPDIEGLLIFLLFILFLGSVSSIIKFFVDFKREYSESRRRSVGNLRIIISEKWPEMDFCLTYLSFVKARGNFRILIEEVLSFGVFSDAFLLNEEQQTNIRSHLYKYGFRNTVIKRSLLQTFNDDSVYVLNVEFEAQAFGKLEHPRDLLVYHGGALIAVPNNLKEVFEGLKKTDYGFITDIRGLPKKQIKECFIKKDSYEKYLTNSIVDTIKYDIDEKCLSFDNFKQPTNQQLVDTFSAFSVSNIQTLLTEMDADDSSGQNCRPVPFNYKIKTIRRI